MATVIIMAELINTAMIYGTRLCVNLYIYASPGLPTFLTVHGSAPFERAQAFSTRLRCEQSCTPRKVYNCRERSPGPVKKWPPSIISPDSALKSKRPSSQARSVPQVAFSDAVLLLNLQPHRAGQWPFSGP